jgi:hypothetical protein
MFEEYEGYVQADAATGFDALFTDGRRIEIGCNAHARRKFFECPNNNTKAQEILQIYHDIYVVEALAKEGNLPPDKLLQWRQETSKPLFEQLKNKHLAIRLSELPKSNIALASQYSLQHWDALTRYLDDPDFEIDNNHSERAIKDFVLARKNFLFLGSQSGGNAAAICLSILASAKRNAIEPWHCLEDVFSRINSVRTNQLDQFLPDIWLKSQSLID